MDDKEHCWHDFPHLPRLSVLPWLIWAVVIGLVFAVALYASKVNALPLFQAAADGIKIVLTDEPCKLEAVSNLPKHATWHEKGKVYHGCYKVHPVFPVIMGYFADKTVVILPAEMFTRVIGV